MLATARRAGSKAKRVSRSQNRPIVAVRCLGNAGGGHRWPPERQGPFPVTELPLTGKYSNALAIAIKNSGLYDWYTNAMGYRRYGLLLDDLQVENVDVQLALARLPPEVLSDRDERHKKALMCYSGKRELPLEEHTKPEDDKPYLGPYLDMVVAERMSREAFRSK
eukprot:TRINITY_DN11726_c0_g1_i1.p1 TRINITY_DN11726_c0_g1~~TRINITY_DN11726_c0_g1_i1.p1  ORF type:complete len:165 (+),score=44.43 TRINITY_DN11726_c0_g1_i1:49-543(+)